MRTLLFCVAVALASFCSAADLTVPSGVTGSPGDFITIKATTTTGTIIKWIALDPNLKLFPTDLLKDTKTAVVSSNVPGTYKLLSYTSDKDGPSDPGVTTITIASPTPIPPPTPVDPLSDSLQAAFAAEKDGNKAVEAKVLSSLYSQASVWANDPNNATWGQLFSTLSAAANTLGITGKLPTVQAILQKELQTEFPVTTQTPIASGDRTKAAATFARFSNLLGGLK